MRLVALGCAVVLLWGCKSRRVRDTETEVLLARTRVAALDAKREALLAERKRLVVSRKTLAQQADEAELARSRLSAAAAVLRGERVPDGIQLDEALRSKSPRLGALAAEIVQRQLPCDDGTAGAHEEPGDGPYDCVPPLADNCEGVPERLVQELAFTCPQLAAGPGGPPVAVCLAGGEWDPATFPIDVPGERVEGDLVRLAFAGQHGLRVADWPAPSVDVYRPVNHDGLGACEGTNAQEACVRRCEERFGRVGCDGEYDETEGDHGEEDDSGESEAVRQARLEAERAEAEARRAREELEYQECLGACEQSPYEAPPALPLRLRYLRAPAPGVFHFEAHDADAGVTPRALVLAFPAWFDAAAGEDSPADDTVSSLELLLSVHALRTGEPSGGAVVLAGVGPAGPAGVRVALDGKAPPVPLSLDETCAAPGKQLSGDRSFVAACDAAKEAARVAEAARAARLAKADAGTPDGGRASADAGATPTPTPPSARDGGAP